MLTPSRRRPRKSGAFVSLLLCRREQNAWTINAKQKNHDKVRGKEEQEDGKTKEEKTNL